MNVRIHGGPGGFSGLVEAIFLKGTDEAAYFSSAEGGAWSQIDEGRDIVLRGSRLQESSRELNRRKRAVFEAVGADAQILFR